MELKFLKLLSNMVSIECSNRTFMELKYEISVTLPFASVSSNRTFMELKCKIFRNVGRSGTMF